MAPRLFLPLLALLLSAPAAGAQAPSDTTRIFRHANLAPGWTVRLGQPVDVPPGLLASGAVGRGAGGTYTRGFYETFDDVAVFVGVTVQTKGGGIVTSMRFDYGPGYNFARERTDYTEMLGAPVRREASPTGETVTWEDRATRFELVREVTPDGERWHSVMSEAQGGRH